MPDSIASFPLRGATSEQLATALGRCFAEYSAWCGQATFVGNFARDARIGGVKSIVAERICQMLNYGEAEGHIVSMSAKTKTNREIALTLAEHQLGTADQGVKIAGIVMLHNACERYFWRLIRFGLVANYAQALRWVGNRKIAVEMLASKGTDACIDYHIEKWWDELERDTLPAKWDRLAGHVHD